MTKGRGGYQNLSKSDFDPVEANPFDEYLTPAPVVDICLECIDRDEAVRPDALILDPASGYGAWGRGISQRWPRSNITGVELRDIPGTFDYDQWIKCQNFLTWQAPKWYHLVVGNPPYGVSEGKRDKRLAQKFIEYGMDMVYPTGRVAYLLKTVFLEGSERMETLFADKYLSHVYVSAKRVAWRPETNGSNSNTVSYALFIWSKKHNGNPKIGWFNHESGHIM